MKCENRNRWISPRSLQIAISLNLIWLHGFVPPFAVVFSKWQQPHQCTESMCSFGYCTCQTKLSFKRNFTDCLFFFHFRKFLIQWAISYVCYIWLGCSVFFYKLSLQTKTMKVLKFSWPQHQFNEDMLEHTNCSIHKRFCT